MQPLLLSNDWWIPYHTPNGAKTRLSTSYATHITPLTGLKIPILLNIINLKDCLSIKLLFDYLLFGNW